MNTTPWLENFKKLLVENDLPYHQAHTVFGDPDEKWCDETSHEWWKGERNIAVFERKLIAHERSGLICSYIDNDPGELLKVWGPNIHIEMESVALDDNEGLVAAWKWFLGV